MELDDLRRLWQPHRFCGSAAREQPLSSRIHEFITTLPLGKRSCTHALHQRKYKLHFEVWTLSTVRYPERRRFNEANRICDLLVLGRWWLSNLCTRGFLVWPTPRVLLPTGASGGYWAGTAKPCHEVLTFKSCAAWFGKNNYSKFAKF